MLALISEKISGKGLAIESIDTDLRLSKDGRREFVVDADFISTVAIDHDHLKEIVDEMSALKEPLSLDVLDVRVHKLK